MCSIGLVNIVEIAVDNDYFEDPAGHADYGLRYLIGIVAILGSCFKLMQW